MLRSNIAFLTLALVAPALAGCIAGGAEEGADLPGIADHGFTIGGFVQGLEEKTDASLVAAKVASLSIEFNQTRVTLVEWRSFTQTSDGCDLVSTMTYEGVQGPGGFLVHKAGEPCPLSMAGRPSVAEVVALADRVPLPLIKDKVLDGAPIFSTELAGYCAYETTEDGTSQVFVWNGRGLMAHTGDVRCGGGLNAGLALAVTLPSLAGRATAPSYVILEQVPSL